MAASCYGYFPLWLLPVMATSRYGYFPLWLLPVMATSRYGYLPLRLLPVMATSHYGCFPLWLLPFVATSHYGYFPLWLRPVMAASHYDYFPLWLLPVMATSDTVWRGKYFLQIFKNKSSSIGLVYRAGENHHGKLRALCPDYEKKIARHFFLDSSPVRGATDLSDGPGALGVHRGVGAPKVRELPRKVHFHVLRIQLRVERLDVDPLVRAPRTNRITGSRSQRRRQHVSETLSIRVTCFGQLDL